MTTYTCSKCGEAGLGMYGHHDSETDGFTCDKKKAEPLPPVAGIDGSVLVALRAEVAKLRIENKRLESSLKTANILLSRRSSETGPLCDF